MQVSEPFLSRTSLLIGAEGVEQLASARLLLAGVGGVGSYAAEALVRAGIGQLTLVDGDTVHPSNINRQLHALNSTLGCVKVDLMAERLLQINPALKITVMQLILTPENIPSVLTSDYSMLLDAIDTIPAKLALIRHARASMMPVISSMGAAGRLDPTRVKLGDLADSHGCRLARKLRKELRKCGIERGVTVVYSDEQVADGYLGCQEQVGERRPLGSISYLPAIFGLFMASAAIRQLLPRQR